MEMKRRQKHISLRCSNQGFTMVELLVAMVVSLLALAAIYSTFLAQHRSYQVQGETADMQQNIRTAMYYMQREIRMAGNDPYTKGIFGFPVPPLGNSTANANVIQFTEDIGDGAVGAPNGLLNTNETIQYRLNNGNLIRNTPATGDQVVAQNIDALDFVYLDDSSPPIVLNPVGGNVPAGSEGLIRSVEITIVARTDDPLLFGSTNNRAYVNQQGFQILPPQGDNVSRRRLTTLIHCRNLSL